LRVLFIYPNLNCQIGFNYGLGQMSAILKEAGHKTGLLNINDKLDFPLNLGRIKREALAFKPDLIGFSVVTNQYPNALRIAQALKPDFPVPFVGGGVHFTMAPELAMEDNVWDFVCVGEGEGALLDLVERLEQGELTNNIPNMVFRRDSAIVRNPVRPFVSLKSLPPTDYELFDFQQMIDAKNGWVSLMASRGCPFRCSYCFNHRMVDIYRRDTGLTGKQLNYIRMRPPQEVADEVCHILDNYRNITIFIFDDDILTLRNDYLRELCDLYKEITAIPFVCNAHVRYFDEETAAILKGAGCRMVKFGLESGSPRVRDQILHRRMSNDEIAKAFATAHEAGLQTSAFVMLGLPDETMEDLDLTIDLLARIKPSRFRWSIFFPFVNTDAYEMSVQGGHINQDKLASLSNFMEASCLDFGPEQNLRIRKLRRTLPWEVNVRAGLEPETYAPLLREIAEMDAQAWDAVEGNLPARDKALSEALKKSDRAHYAIKYNEFMAVREPEPPEA